MYHIIVPIDFSKESLKGLDLAILFSSKKECVIQMVYVQKKSLDYNPGSKEEEHKFAENEFKKIEENYKDKIPDKVELKYIIKSGKIYREIVNQVESFENSFVVTSTHGASGFEKFFIGSNAFKIISGTSKPVVTIRENILLTNISKIVLPIDITSYTRQKLPFTAEIARWFDAEINVLKITSLNKKDINKKLSAYSNQICEYLKNQGVKYSTDSIVGSNFIDLIIDHSKNINADLISVMSEQASDGKFIIGTKAQQMLNKCSLPVLSINPKELLIL